MHKSKKIISIFAAATLAFSTAALSACKSKGGYRGEDLGGYDATATVVAGTNGGFVVEKGEYVYFINGSEYSTSDNTYGDVVKSSLMRISKTEIAAGDYSKAKIVVPSLFVSGNYDTGMYIYGDYVYYATPTNAKNNDGEIENSYLDFKRAKLDESDSPEQLFRLSSNSVKYRFVEVNGTVYCMFEEGGALKSYNVKEDETTILVSGAGAFVYNTADLTDPNVYYTMGVQYGVEQSQPTTPNYNQIYRVNAAATAQTKTEGDEVSYTVYEGDTQIAKYAFDKEAMEEKDCDLGDYTTFPYVNLGKLVLDGVGHTAGKGPYSMDDRFNVDAKFDDDGNYITEAVSSVGYTYTLKNQGNGGIYFTRTDNDKATDEKAAYLYYMSDATTGNTITKNNDLDIVAKESTNASTSAVYRIENGKHVYFYVSGTTLKKVVADEDGTPNETLMTKSLPSGAALWKYVAGSDAKGDDYLYFTATGSNGKSVGRICADGEYEDYNKFDVENPEFEPLTLKLVDFYDSWYKPEFVSAGGKEYLFYNNAQSYGTAGSFYYVYATQLGTTQEILDRNEEIEEIEDYIAEYSENTEVQDVMRYYFRTGETSAYEAVIDLYDDNQTEYFDDFKAKFTSATEGVDPEFKLESKYIALVGRMTEADKEDIAEGWVDSLLKEEEEETDEEGGLPTWAIVLIVCGSVVVVAAGITVPLLIVFKKKKDKKRREEAIVSAYKHKKIDTTDDKSIDVYADETVEETAEENTSEEE